MSARPSATTVRARPTGAPTSTDAPALIGPAIALLRACRDPMDVRLMCDGLPPAVIPQLTMYAAQRVALFDLEIVRELARCCGFGALARLYGAAMARNATVRLFPQPEL